MTVLQMRLSAWWSGIHIPPLSLSARFEIEETSRPFPSLFRGIIFGGGKICRKIEVFLGARDILKKN